MFEQLLFVGGEGGHLRHHRFDMHRKDFRNQLFAFVRQRDRDVAPIFGIAFPPHKPCLFEVVDHQSHIAATSKNLSSEGTLAEWPQKIEGFEHPKLANRQVYRVEVAVNPGRHCLGCPHQLDVGIECLGFL